MNSDVALSVEADLLGLFFVSFILIDLNERSKYCNISRFSNIYSSGHIYSIEINLSKTNNSDEFKFINENKSI